MDNKKHTINRKHEQLLGARFSLKNELPAAVRLHRKREWPEMPVKHFSSKACSVFVPDLLCLLRLERGAATDFILFNCLIGGLCKTACAGVVFDGGIEQFRIHLYEFALHSFQRGVTCCKESVVGFGCRGLLPILSHF